MLIVMLIISLAISAGLFFYCNHLNQVFNGLQSQIDKINSQNLNLAQQINKKEIEKKSRPVRRGNKRPRTEEQKNLISLKMREHHAKKKAAKEEPQQPLQLQAVVSS